MKKIITLFLVMNFTIAFSQPSTIYIPTVFHVVYGNSSENVSDSIIFQHLQALNTDFSDTTCPNTYAKDAYTYIQFCLASADPNGNPTNGITRTPTTVSQFTTDNKVKFSMQGGQDAWDRDKYLNIWICDIGTLPAFGQFPNGNATTDGVVLNYKYMFGGYAPYDLGRQGVFAIANWLGVKRLYGGCSIEADSISDTPPQASVIICTSQIDVCSGIPFSVLGKNFMQESPEACMCFFTSGQVAKMWTTLNGPRTALLTSTGCALVTEAHDPVFEKIISVFPNPSVGKFEIWIDHAVREINIVVFNALGQEVADITRGEKNILLDLSDNAPGIYYVRIIADGSVAVKQLTVLK